MYKTNKETKKSNSKIKKKKKNKQTKKTKKTKTLEHRFNLHKPGFKGQFVLYQVMPISWTGLTNFYVSVAEYVSSTLFVSLLAEKQYMMSYIKICQMCNGWNDRLCLIM